MSNALLNEGRKSMEGAIANFEQRLGTLRSGRANASLLHGVMVNYYGSPTPLDQIGQISVSEGTQLVVKLFDPSSLKDAERAISEAHPNLPVQNDGTLLRINVPKLTEETRREVAKDVSKFAEESKIAVRNIRRDLNDLAKDDDTLTEDQEKKMLEDVQKLTDEFVNKIEEISKAKTKEIMTV
ncbi:ribosome recycling factor [Erysipelothrix larvae]|uniref:Ribosome-recycling factor n=1 Tax=Erysipelothrix larvae TaxID=1514105 RepID=A0A120JTK9_9FIRM|nr:ribosome recycling factor [Erysipelothrix larvae]AMC93195.1 ribosome recycling factor [Erysipelothrix larvae]